MAAKSPNVFDQEFNSIQFIRDSAGNLITRTSGVNIGTRPLTLQFGSTIGVAWNPVTDRIEVGVAGNGFVPDSLALASSAPLTLNGGYATTLAGPVTFTVLIDNTSVVTDGGGNLAVGTIDATQHGVQTDGSLHADATAVTAGFMPPGMFTLLDTATNASDVGTIVRRDGTGEASFDAVRIDGTTLYYDFATTGGINIGGSEPVSFTDQGEAILGPNVAIGKQSTGDPDAYQTGSGVMWFEVATVEPTAAPTTGVYLWYFGGNLKAWKSGAGAPVVIV